MTKTRIGITQRVDFIKEYDERRDCLDQNWSKFLSKAGVDAVPIPNNLNNLEQWVRNFNLKGFVLTGGNDLSELPNAVNAAPERDRTEMAILDFASRQNMPVLGVCRGFQLINVYNGGKLSPVNQHAAIRHKVKAITDDPRWKLYEEVNSFHNWGITIKDIAADLTSVMLAKDGTIEAAFHNILNQTGIMWHPEREKKFLDADLNLFIDIFR